MQEAVVGPGAVVALLADGAAAADAAVERSRRPRGPATAPSGRARRAGGAAARARSRDPRRDRAKSDELTLKSVSQTVRVDIRKLDNLHEHRRRAGDRARRAARRSSTRSRPIARRPSSRATLHHELRSLVAQARRAAGRHPRGAHGAARAGLRQAVARGAQDLARRRQGDPPRASPAPTPSSTS